VFKHTGDGICAVFASPSHAVVAAAAMQAALASEDWGPAERVLIRIGVHTGEAELRGEDYFGPSLSRVARLMDSGHGGQTLLSNATASVLGGSLPDGFSLRDLGEHRFKDLLEPDTVYQLEGGGLGTDFLPLRSLEAVPNNLPEQLSSFIGREKEVATLIELLGGSRLVTLTGVGGVGKTRLAIQTGAESVELYPDGVFLVELAPISDPALITREIAAAVGVTEEATRPLIETLVEHIADSSMLLIIDNCEHVISGAAKLSEQLLRSGSGIRIIATSREGLGIAGERLWQVPSMGAVEGESEDAVELFAARARLVRPDFALTDETRPAVEQICDRLDGIPLAIELATARLKVFSPAQIAERIDDRFRLLTGGSRTALERQRTLQATMDWSYDLLTEHEQALLRRLSVFHGGFTFEAAEEVCEGELLPRYEILDLLTHLVETSMVLAEDRGEVRYRLLETVRQYAMDRLVEAGEQEDGRLRHATFYCAMSEPVHDELLGPEYVAVSARLTAELDNLRAAMTWTLEHHHADLALKIAAGMGRFWFFRGYYREGLDWLRRSLDATSEVSIDRVSALGWMSGIGLHLGTYDAAFTAAEQSVRMAQELGDETLAARESNTLANAMMLRGDINGAAPIYEACVEYFESRGNSFYTVPLVNLGVISAWRGRVDEAADVVRRLEDAAVRFGNDDTLSWAAAVEGFAAGFVDDVDGMADAYSGALAAAGKSGQRLIEGWALAGLAEVARRKGDLDLADDYVERAQVVVVESGATSVDWTLLWVRIYLAEDRDDEEGARRWMGVLVNSAIDRRDLLTLGRAASEAAYLVRTEHPVLAAQLIGLSAATREPQDVPLALREQQLSDTTSEVVRQDVGEERFATEVEAGRELDIMSLPSLLPFD
jgi:predicted ATPase